MVLIDRRDDVYELRRIPLPSEVRGETKTRGFIAGHVHDEEDVEIEFRAIGYGMYLACSERYMHIGGSFRNEPAEALVLLHDMHRGPARTGLGRGSVIGPAMILGRSEWGWCDLSPMQLSKLEEWFGEGWFDGEDHGEVVSRCGGIHIGSTVFCEIDDYGWDAVVKTLMEAVIQRARSHTPILCRIDSEGGSGVLVECDGRICYLQSGGSCGDCSVSDHLMAAEDFARGFVDGMERFARCDPKPVREERLDSRNYTNEMQKYILDSVDEYRTLAAG